jgi:hypothetical protein
MTDGYTLLSFELPMGEILYVGAKLRKTILPYFHGRNTEEEYSPNPWYPQITTRFCNTECQNMNIYRREYHKYHKLDFSEVQS